MPLKIMIKIVGLASACFLFTEAPSRAATDEANLIGESIMSELPIPALSVAVYADGGIAWSRAYGTASIELDVPATVGHRFRLGSVSKIVTASIAARMVDQGLVDLDAPIVRYLPELPEHHHSTTLRQLLGHLGGVRNYNRADFDLLAPGSVIDLRIYPDTESALSLFINDPLIAPAGTTYSYSTFGYTLVSAVLESAGNASFSDLLSQYVTEPLSLESLQTDRLFDLRPGRVSLYDLGDVYRQRIDPTITDDIVNALSNNPAYKWAGGGLIATPSDLARFGAAFIESGFLTSMTFTEVFTVQNSDSDNANRVGLGWRVDHDSAGRLRYHHAGEQQGARSVLIVYPEHDVVIAMMSNLGGIPQDILSAAASMAETFID